jgi:cell division transport system permease protein
MRALRYFFVEAAASLWRGRGAALVSIITIAIGLFVLGLFLVVNTNLQGLAERWSRAAELSIFLGDAITPEQQADIEAALDRSGLLAGRQLVTKAQAADRFRADFPDLAGTADALGSNPFPASIDVQLRPEVDGGAGAVEALVTGLRALPGVTDVRYDRDWLARLNAIVRGVRIAGIVLVTILTVAAAMTVANVVRLAAAARRDEIEIMQLVGAPYAYVRGPFVAEGVLQGGLGALVALAGLAGAFYMFRLRYGGGAAAALGTEGLTFLTAPVIALLLVGGMGVGCLASYLVARAVR